MVETDLFEHREVKPHFINPCCFGEDFAVWLRGQLGALTTAGFELGDHIQEDYGWGFWITHGKDRYWLALAFCGEGPTEEPAQWAVTIAYDPGLDLMRRLFRRPDAGDLGAIQKVVWDVLRNTPMIKVLEEDT